MTRSGFSSIGFGWQELLCVIATAAYQIVAAEE